MNGKLAATTTAIFITGLVAFQSAHAALLTFTDRNAWEIAVGAFQTENFNALSTQDFGDGTHNVGLFDLVVSGTGSLNFPVAIADSSNGLNIDGSNFIRGAALPAAGPTLRFLTQVIGFGGDWTSTSSAGLLTLTVLGDTIEFDTVGVSTGFLGVISDTPFTDVVLRTETTPTEGFGLDNVSFSPVPEPATLALFGLGLAGLGFARRRKTA